MEGGGSFAPTDWTAVKGQANGPGREEARGRGSGCWKEERGRW